MSGKYFVGINADYVDPAVSIVRDGRVLASAEEERFIRNKHARGQYPIRALKYCLETAGVSLSDVAAVAINWNLDAYTDGRMKSFYESIAAEYPVDAQTLAWQLSRLKVRNLANTRRQHESQWQRHFGMARFPPLVNFPHHFTHAFQAYAQSSFNEAVTFTVDGSGDQHTAVLWACRGTEIKPIHEVTIPHSLGWVYAAFTEYLGFEAYDGEYKVMGLAAYGRPVVDLLEKMNRIILFDQAGPGYSVDPTFIHYGAHNYSDRYTDKLVDLFGRAPRLEDDEVLLWHEDVAYAVQATLERAAERLVTYGMDRVGTGNVCVSGGVGLNVKMNSKLFNLSNVRNLFPHPLCADSGATAGAALLACYQATGCWPEPLRSLALGYEESDEQIEKLLNLALIDYAAPNDIAEAVADEIAQGRVVGWFQGRMEAGPRALGQRSILADARFPKNRDRVNAIIKFREYWRPFCPSMTAEAAPRYFVRYVDAPFMIIAFEANEKLRQDAPAVVHVDGTSRVQLVHSEVLPLYHRLLKAFERRTGVPVLLNTSFNVKGEPIVCSAKDALRTFWSTGLEVMALGRFLIRKPRLGRAD